MTGAAPRLLRRLMLVWLMAACSSSEEPPGDPGHVHFESGCATTDAIAFPDAAPGQTATMIVHVVNDTDTDVVMGPPEDVLRIEGPDAADFEILQFDSSHPLNQMNCTRIGKVLYAHSWCQLSIEFHPSEPGPKQATYAVGAAGSLALAGSAVAPAPALVASRANVAAGYIPIDGESLLLRNDSSSAVNLGTLSVDPPFVLSSSCPASLPSGAACSIGVSVPREGPPINECRSGQLTASMTTLRLPLAYTPALFFPKSFSTWLVGRGAGTVTSSGGELDCNVGSAGPGCQARWWVPPTSITLTATPAEGSELIAWMSFGRSELLPCGNAAECTLPISPPNRQGVSGEAVQAWFAPVTDKHIRVNIVGTGDVYGGPILCNRSCTFSVEPGRPLTLSQRTTGAFLGWSGDCTSTGAGQCDLGIVVNDRTVTATFGP